MTKRKQLGQEATLSSTVRSLIPKAALQESATSHMKKSLPRSDPPDTRSERAMQVLVIEDNHQDQELVATFLDATHYDVQIVDRGGLGVSAAVDQVPDVILLDLRLPDLDGYEVCRLLREEPRTKRIPVVIVTASDDPALNRLAYAAGAQGCLTKPFRKEALVTVIEAVLAGVGRSKSKSGRKRRRSTAEEPKGRATAWETLEPFRGYLIWVKQLDATGWIAAVTPLPPVSDDRAPAVAPSNEMVFPEKFDSRETAEVAARRYIDRENDRQIQGEAREVEERMSGPEEQQGERRFMRFPVFLPVIGRCPQLDHGEILGVVRNVSAGGLMVEFPVELGPGRAMDLALLTERGPLEVEARTVWTAIGGGTVRHGLAFPQPKERDFAAGLSIKESR